ncbi:MAG: thioredoxin-disulfide reductase [Deltaproteobacteria bacterium]|nr:thioredoxin-disulfide reductase [Deltaproteobacteria bacterium]
MEDVIILGTGCAGLTAAIYTGRAQLNPLVLEGTQPGGQLTTTSEVENFPGFPEGIDGFMMMDNLRKQAARFGARYEHAKVDKIEIQDGIKKLFAGDKVYEANTVIVATGARPRLLGIAGEQEMYGGKGVTTCATCDGAFYRDMDVVVVGGGDSAAEEALFLTRFCSKVTMIHRRGELRASQIMADRATSHEKIEMAWNTSPIEVLADDKGFCRAIRIQDTVTSEEREIPCKGVFIAIGHIPNTDFVENLLERDGDGYIVTEPSSQVKTKYAGFYAAGDCVDHVYRQAITAAGMGCQAAIEAERWLAERES